MRLATAVGAAVIMLALALAAGACTAALGDEPPTAARQAAAVLMPDLRLLPERTSGLTVVGWQQVVALRPRARDADGASVVLVSCAPAPGVARDADAGESCVAQILGWLPRLRRGPTLAAGPDKVVAVVGPEHLIHGLAGPRDIPSELFPQAASEKKTAAGETSPITQTAVEAPPGWTTSLNRGVLTAWAAAAPQRRVRIVGRSLTGLSNLNPAAPEAAASLSTSEANPAVTQTYSLPAQETRDLPISFARVQFVAPLAGPLGPEPLCLRFVPPPLPPDCRVAVDTGAMWVEVPPGWEVVYLEERTWFDRRMTPGHGAARWSPGYWPWLPLARDESATASAPAKEGVLAVGARAAGVSAAVLGWPGPAQEVGSVLPVMQAVLGHLRLATWPNPDEAAAEDRIAADPLAGGAFGEGMLPDHTAFVDSPEWIALLMEDDLAVQARNRAIFEGREIVDPDAEAASERMEEAVIRLNEELLSIYPEGGDPSGWVHERLQQLAQELLDEEVMRQ